MNIEQVRTYCLAKQQVTEHFPFDDNVLVFKVAGKMFLLTGLDTWEKGEAAINLKCDPDHALELREQFESIEPGYHMSKKHWNTVRLCKGEIDWVFTKELIDQSYDLIVKSLPKKVQVTFK